MVRRTFRARERPGPLLERLHEERRSRPALPLPSRSPGPSRAPLPTDPVDLPPLPAAFHDAVAAGCAAWGISLDTAQLAALDHHARLLVAWTSAINLTAVREPQRVAVVHVLDSLSAVPLLRRLARPGPRLADLGSGGGYPGLPLVVALPAETGVLVESVAKKGRFLQVAADAAMSALAAGRPPGDRSPSVRVEARRAEALAADPTTAGSFDVVTVRAVGSLAAVAALALPLLREGGTLVAWKRDGGDGRLAAELEAAVPTVLALGGDRPRIEPLPPGVADLATHRLVVVQRVRELPGGGHRLLG